MSLIQIRLPTRRVEAPTLERDCVGLELAAKRLRAIGLRADRALLRVGHPTSLFVRMPDLADIRVRRH